MSAEFGQRVCGKVNFRKISGTQFRRMLDYFGQSPIIVRSSSLLEDGFGNAFAGKYESVFCVNVGEMEERLEKFEEAVKTVYASTMDPSALEYRRNFEICWNVMSRWHFLYSVCPALDMSLSICRPAAGVGYSYNAYKWMENMDPKAGMLRLVLGLGTRAVDRTSGDYPKIISLDRPQAQILMAYGGGKASLFPASGGCAGY